ncbi:hypothetical protein ISCGN_001913 [Ixodes scapularis]
MAETDEVQNSDKFATADAKMPGNRRSRREVRSRDLASTVLVAISKVTELHCTVVEHPLQPQTDFSFTLSGSGKEKLPLVHHIVPIRTVVSSHHLTQIAPIQQ